ncbi:glycosyltransferase family 2 protein [Pseudogemmobacter faecipullorum]|uniref:Glycosyltransferase family 2 protein n=1 Tax=Pseudogemmobacter faecipullorum TaxID=2755041 RepID=A0ABS8CLU7_9RHOB|nr:glycosyltransferase family 2 protein [Pseudogemmobacter faecipullorum]MCB5410190.1 glycosyltransferase family 2 protein [Pseudogemmobacter faecipullorum]
MRILAVTSVKDEAPFLLEWLAWHQLIGVTDFWIASNDCEDGTDRLLDLLMQHGLLHHHPQRPDRTKSIQWQALKAAWVHPLRQSADWMLISDVDEFPMIHCGSHRLGDLIAALPAEAEAVALAWRLFGANGQSGLRDLPVTGQFTRSAPPDMVYPVAATFFKSLFRPAAFHRPGVHRPLRGPGQGPARWSDGSGRAMTGVLAEDKRLSLLGLEGHRSLAEMHHYSLRSVESFVVKSARGLPNRASKPIDLHYWVGRNFNNQLNEAALVLAGPLAEGIARLKALPGVAEAHEAALASHRASFARLVQSPGGYQLWSSCLQAAGSAALPPRLTREVYERFQRVERSQPEG